MDIKKELIPLKKELSNPINESEIRTMSKDIAKLQKDVSVDSSETSGLYYNRNKKTDSSPVVAPLDVPKPPIPSIPTTPLIEKEDLSPPTFSKKAAPPLGLPTLESAKKSFPVHPETPKPVEIPKQLPKENIFPTEMPKRVSFLSPILIGLVIILIITSIGGTFYWFNYLRIEPEEEVHYECSDGSECVVVDGQGINQCQIDEDCQIVEEEVIPDSLIPVNETKTIDLISGQENMLFDELKSIIAEEQITNTFNRILIRMTDEQEQEYIDLNVFASIFGLSFPEDILQYVDSFDIEAGNYTLFSYRQEEGVRLGIVIAIAPGIDLVQEMINWEEYMINDINSLFLGQFPILPQEIIFQDSERQDVLPHRYINLPDSLLSIDYVLLEDKLIITTSKESINAVIDVLLKEE